MAEVFTEEWARAACERLNAREGYREHAAQWRDAVVLVMGADEALGVAEERAVYLDLFEGACRATRLATAADLAGAPVVLRAQPAHWRLLLAGETDPVAAVMKGQLRLVRGSVFTLAKYAAAAREMVAAAAEAGGHFPNGKDAA